MQQLNIPDLPGVTIQLRRSTGAKRLSMRICSLTGQVKLTAPSWVPMGQIQAFLTDKQEWIRGHLSKMSPVSVIEPGAVIPIEGHPHELRHAPKGPSHIGDGALYIGGRTNHFAAKVEGVLKAHARARLAAACDHYAAKLGRPFSSIVLRDTRSRWGSCSAQGRLMFSWRLIMAPPDILSYVAAHEVAHLRHMNHSRAYWDCLTDIHGPWEKKRQWLHDNGASLHRYQFDD